MESRNPNSKTPRVPSSNMSFPSLPFFLLSFHSSILPSFLSIATAIASNSNIKSFHSPSPSRLLLPPPSFLLPSLSHCITASLSPFMIIQSIQFPYNNYTTIPPCFLLLTCFEPSLSPSPLRLPSVRPIIYNLDLSTRPIPCTTTTTTIFYSLSFPFLCFPSCRMAIHQHLRSSLRFGAIVLWCCALASRLFSSSLESSRIESDLPSSFALREPWP